MHVEPVNRQVRLQSVLRRPGGVGVAQLRRSVLAAAFAAAIIATVAAIAATCRTALYADAGGHWML